jgi:predicted MFS family arabinose efflux permease
MSFIRQPEQWAPPSASAPGERLLLLILTAVQFTHCLDFMIILPLAEDLMREFDVSPTQFGYMVAVYSISAAIVGFGAGFFMDRISRHIALLVLYAGLTVATFWCAFAPSFAWLVAARSVTGLCGGVAASVVGAIIADTIPPWRRGKAMAWVGTAFPIAQVFGLPAGLWCAKHYGWQSAFVLLGCMCLLVLAVAYFTLPPLPPKRPAEAAPVRQMREILTHPLHIRAFLLSGVLLFAGALVAPFMALAMEKNGGLDKDDIALMYFCGGIVVFFTTRFFGIMSDRYDKLLVLSAITPFVILAVLAVTHWEHAPLWVTLLFTTLFFVTMSGRFSPAMTMVSNAIEARYRGGFMSVNAAVQQTCASLAHVTAGALITKEAVSGKLIGFDNVGILAAVMFVLTIFFAGWLRRGAPWAAKNDIQAPEAYREGERK